MLFDNTKIKRVVPDFTATIPFLRGADEILAWFDADPARRTGDEKVDRLLDKIMTAYESA